MELLIDTNVVLDMFLEREPFVGMSRQVIALSRRYNNVYSFISASSVTDIYYITYKNLKNHQIVREKFKKLFKFVGVVTVTDKDIHAAFALSVQYAVAKSNNFDGIVTRNMQGFTDDTVKIFTPEEVCRYVETMFKE